MLVNSAQHSFIVAFHPEMPSYIASFWITFECAVIIMISWLIASSGYWITPLCCLLSQRHQLLSIA